MNQPPNEYISDQTIFPPLSSYDSGLLKGSDFFSAWKGFRADGDASSGEIPIFVYLDNEEERKPSAAQINAYRYLKENESAVTESLLLGLFADYPQIRAVYDIDPEYIPVIERAEDFRRLIKPINIHINSESEDGYACIGFEFDCLWDIEHGLGVMMHRTEYIGCNDAEAAWNLDLARS